MIEIKQTRSIKTTGTSSLKVLFSYNPEIINIIKCCDGAVWLKSEKMWEVPQNSLSYLIDNLTFIDDIKLSIQKEKDDEKLDIVCKHKTKMFDYQEDGVRYLLNNKNCLLLDVPGLGKSIMSIYLGEELKKQKKYEHCLIICGINSLKTNWKREIEKHSDLDCVIIGEKINSKGKVTYSSVKDRADQLYHKIKEYFVILNIESLRDSLVVDAILNGKNKFDLIICDEAHKCKDPTSQQGKNFLKLSKVGERHICLTGTLLLNSPFDSYVPLKFIGHEKSTWTNFKKFYGSFGFEFGHAKLIGYKNIDILKSEIEKCSLRRLKDKLNLPPKVIVPEVLDLDEKHKSFYTDIQNGTLEEADKLEIKKTSLLGLVTRQRQASTCPELLTSLEFKNVKLERAAELIEEITSNGEKVIVFSSFKDPLNRLYERISKYNPLLGTGDITDQEFSENIDKFQNDKKYKVFLATTSKAGTGITLTAASYEIFLDSTWTEALETQCEDRAYRLGTEKPVIIYKLIGKDTIDERVQKILERKRVISDYIIDNTVSDDLEELKELLGVES